MGFQRFISSLQASRLGQFKKINLLLFYKIAILFAVFFILIYALSLRLYQLNYQSWWMDEAYSINAAISTLDKGLPILDSGFKYYGQLAFTYPLSGLIWLLGLSQWSSRILSVFFNLAAIGVIYLFAKKFFNKNTAYLTSFFLLFSFWEIAWSRQARNYTEFQLFFWLALYFFWLCLYQYKTKYLIGLIFASFFAFFTHHLALLLLPIYLVSVLIAYGPTLWRDKKSLLGRRNLLIAILTILPLAIFSPKIYQEIAGRIITPIFYLPHYFNWLFANFLIPFLSAAIAIFFAKTKTEKQKIWLIYITFLIPLLALSFFIFLLQYRYLFVVLPAIYLLAAYVLTQIFTQTKKTFKIAVIIALIVYMILSPEFIFLPQKLFFLESDQPDAKYSIKSYTPQPDWQGAYNFIKSVKKPEDLIISAQPVFTKIYLNQPGYWISYSLEGQNTFPEKNRYVGAGTILTLEDLLTLTQDKHGYIILDFLSLNKRISQDIIDHIKQNMEQIYFNTLNAYSSLWVYKF